MCSTWHLGQHEEPVQPRGHVLYVNSKVHRAVSREELFVKILMLLTNESTTYQTTSD